MDRTELTDILREERGSSIRSINADFYPVVEEYIKELEAEIYRLKNPRSVEAKILEDELQNAITSVELIFMRRIKKIIASATTNAFSSRTTKPDMGKLLSGERDVYEAVLSAINNARKQMLEPVINPHMTPQEMYCDPERNTRDKSIDDRATAKEQLEDGNSAPEVHDMTPSKDVTKGIGVEQVRDDVVLGANGDRLEKDEKGQVPKSNINKEFVVVRILEKVPTFKAMDNRNYTLSAEDLVVLPALNAKGLVKRKVAQLITDN